MRDLGRRARKLEAALKAQKEASGRSRARLEDQVQVAYKGGDLEGLLLLLEGLFKEDSTSFATLQAMRLLTGSSRSVQDYKDTKQNLRSTLRQVEQSKAEYREFEEESQILVEGLMGRESELQASVEGLGLERDRMEERLAELEAEEEAGLFERPPATGGGDEGKTQGGGMVGKVWTSGIETMGGSRIRKRREAGTTGGIRTKRREYRAGRSRRGNRPGHGNSKSCVKIPCCSL